jgi:hypothetical protein
LQSYPKRDGGPVFYRQADYLLAGYSLFNPRGRFTLVSADGAETTYSPTDPGWATAKWLPSSPTSPHWYTAEWLRDWLRLTSPRSGPAARR